MQVKTELRPMFSYNIVYIAIFLGLLLIVLLIYYRLTKTKAATPQIIIPPKEDLNNIKNKYLGKIDNLRNDYQNNKYSLRKTYQLLSTIIRNFIYESTNIKVQNYTLSEIANINIPLLYELIKEYYNPEFASHAEGNIILSFEKTRKVIETWK